MQAAYKSPRATVQEFRESLAANNNVTEFKSIFKKKRPKAAEKDQSEDLKNHLKQLEPYQR